MKFNYKIDGRKMNEADLFSAILKEKGVDDKFLHPTDNDLVPFNKMKNIGKAENILSYHKMIGSKISILADVDCDGATSCAIIYRYLVKSGFKHVTYMINTTKSHGVSGIIEDKLKALDGVDLLIIVDSMDSMKEYNEILKSGIDIICLDHHVVPDDVANSDNDRFALVSSANDYPNSELSGAGVCLKFCMYLDMINLTNYADNLYDLAACGIVADMCSTISPENRYIIQKGLNNPQNPAIKKIVGSYEFNSKAISFSVSPKVNACVRTGRNNLAVDMFLCDNDDELSLMLAEAENAKEDQANIISAIMPELESQIETQKDSRCLFLIAGSCAQGVCGVIANKIMMSLGKTTFVVREDADGIYRGSMRGLGVEDVLSIVNKSGLATCEGHELASGFECKKENVNSLVAYLNETLPEPGACDECTADVIINPKQLTDSFIRNIKIINRISGKDFKSVTVMMESSDITVSCMSKGKHLKVIDNETGALFVKWNDPSYLDRSMHKKIVGYGTPETAFYGKVKYKQIILENYETYEEI